MVEDSGDEKMMPLDIFGCGPSFGQPLVASHGIRDWATELRPGGVFAVRRTSHQAQQKREAPSWTYPAGVRLVSVICFWIRTYCKKCSSAFNTSRRESIGTNSVVQLTPNPKAIEDRSLSRSATSSPDSTDRHSR